jgi:hypothetical protein
VVSAEAAKQRLEKAAACACAIVRFTEIPGLTISSISQVRDPTEYEDSDEAALHAAIPQRFPDSRTEYKVTWFGKEALLPSGSYVLSYRVGGTDALMMISSGGTGRDFVVTPPIPEERPGFRFVGAGDHCGGRDVRMAPFLIRQTAEDSLLDWPTAHFSAARLHGRLPTTDELLCAAKLGMLPGGTDSWSWSFEANPAGTLDGGHQVVRHNVVRGGRRDGRALLHVTRPIGRVASELAIKVSDRQTTRERPLATTNTKYSSSTTTEATSVPAPSPLDVENLALAPRRYELGDHRDRRSLLRCLDAARPVGRDRRCRRVDLGRRT